MNTIVFMYITLLPTILAGIFNMVWCKMNILEFTKIPIDGGRVLGDNRRVFGDSKTWKGLIGYCIGNVFFSIFFGLLATKIGFLESHNYFYINHSNTILLNVWIGLLLGLGYSLFELPNSFIKRRLNIDQSLQTNNKLKALFIFIDQADSIFGCALVVWMFYDLGIVRYICYILVGAFTHIIINMLLYLCHLRKNMF